MNNQTIFLDIFKNGDKKKQRDAIPQSKTEFIITCVMLILCFDFFRVIGNLMESWNVSPFLVYGIVIVLSIIAPILLILYGFRDIPPFWGFLAVFVITGPITILIDLVFFSTAPFDLLATPQYIRGIIIVSLLLGAIAYGVTIFSKKPKIAFAIIIPCILLYLFQVKGIFFDLLMVGGTYW